MTRGTKEQLRLALLSTWIETQFKHKLVVGWALGGWHQHLNDPQLTPSQLSEVRMFACIWDAVDLVADIEKRTVTEALMTAKKIAVHTYETLYEAQHDPRSTTH